MNDGATGAVTVSLRDGAGNRVETLPGGAELQWSTFGSTVARVRGDELTAVVDGLRPGRTTLRVSLGTLSASAPVEVRQVPTQLLKQGPPVVLGLSGELAPQPARVQVLDRHGSPVAGVPVFFRVVTGGGAVARDRVVSDAFGFAETPWVLGSVLGLQTLEADAEGPSPTQIFSYVNGDLASVTLSAVSVGGSAGTVGEALPDLLEIRARDSQGRPVLGIGVEWTASAGTLLPTSPVTDVQGRARARWVLGPNPGLQTASVRLTLPDLDGGTASGVPGGGVVTFQAEAQHATPTRVSVLPQRLVLQLGNAARANVAVLDALGNVIPGPHATNWVVESSSIASAELHPSGDAILSGVRPGETRVVVTVGGLADTLDLVVRPVDDASGGGGGSTLASLSVAPDTLFVDVGTSGGLAATALDTSGQLLPTSDAVWSTDDPEVATVDAFGRVTAWGIGTTRTTVSLGSLQASATVVVSPTSAPPPGGGTPQRITDVRTADATTTSLKVLFTAGHDGAGNPALHEIRWAASPLGWGWGQARVLETGGCASPIRPRFVGEQVTCTITGLTPGRSYDVQMVTWRADGGTNVYSPLSNVATGVTPGATGDPASLVDRVVVSPSTAVVTPNGTLQLTATPLDAAGNALGGLGVAWSSTNEAVATVDGSGRVTGVADGAVSIRATVGSRVGTSSISVSSEAPSGTVSRITVTPSAPSLAQGGTQQLTATARDDTGAIVPGVSFSWASSDAGIATVDASGRVTARQPGTASITASAEGFTGTSVVTVTGSGGGGPGPVANLTLSPAFSTLLPGGSVSMVAVATDASGTTVPGVAFTWSSTDPGVATVDGGGRVTAVSPGSATVRVSGAGFTASASVSVITSSPGGVWLQQDWNYPDRAAMLADPSLQDGGTAGGQGGSTSRPAVLSSPGPWGGTTVLENYYGVIPATGQPQVGTHWYLPDGARELWLETWVRFAPEWSIYPDNPLYPGNVDHKLIFVWEGSGGPWTNRWECKVGPWFTTMPCSANSHDTYYQYMKDPPSNVYSPQTRLDANTAAWDGQWHRLRMHLRMGTTDGRMRVWWDNRLTVDSGLIDTKSGNRWFDAITFGGNRNQGTDHPMSFYFGPARLYRTDPGW